MADKNKDSDTSWRPVWWVATSKDNPAAHYHIRKWYTDDQGVKYVRVRRCHASSYDAGDTMKADEAKLKFTLVRECNEDLSAEVERCVQWALHR